MLALTSDALYELFIRSPASSRISEEFQRADGNFYAPPQMEMEIFSALRGLCRTNVLTVAELRDRMEALRRLPYVVIRVPLLVDHMLRIGENALEVSDGLYIATALWKSAPLLTVRPELAAQAQRSGADVILISQLR